MGPLLWLSALVLIALLGFRISFSHQRFLDNDELEHLNGAYFISQGETIYQSFFENHPPLLVWALQPIVRSSESPEVIVSHARLGIFAVQIGILILAGMMARRLGGNLAAWLAPSLLLTQSFFYQKTLEVRPDVPALFFFMLALERMGATELAALNSRGAMRRGLLIGAYLCIAGLFTPKLIYAVIGAVLAFAYANHRVSKTGGSHAIRSLMWIGVGGTVVAALAAGELARQGILEGFIQDAVLQSLRMTIDDPAWYRRTYLSETARIDAVTWLLAIAGFGLALFARHNGTLRRDQGTLALVLASSAGAGLLGLMLIEAPLRQYFLCFVPQSILFASWALARGSETVLLRKGPRLAGVALSLSLAVCLASPLVRVMKFDETHRAQLEVIQAVRASSTSRQRVFACWSGLYLTRLPAYRYFFLNSDVQRLLDPEKLERELLELLAHPEVAVYLPDRNCNKLPRGVKRKLRETFMPHSDFPRRVWLRRPGL